MQTYTITIQELLERGVDEVIDTRHLTDRLHAGEKLRVKLGIDPTSPHIHLGRSVVLLKLRDFQLLGHTVVFVIGDFTGVIGDTSDKDAERKILSSEVVADNMKTYIAQAGKIIDMKTAEVRYNSEWLGELTYQEIAMQADAFSLSEFTARKNINDRLQAGKRVSLRELLYPLMQGYDSVALHADVELGGTDQRFNLLAGRTMQEHYGKSPQDILTTHLIPGLDGRKMSSSWGNTINITDEPDDMYGKIMSMDDAMIEPYTVHCTRMVLGEAPAHPRDAKMRLARELVRMYWGGDSAHEAEDRFITQFQKKEIPNDIPTLSVQDGESVTDIIIRTGFVMSKAEARRMITQGGVTLDGEKIMDPATHVTRAGVLRVGKRHIIRLSL